MRKRKRTVLQTKTMMHTIELVIFAKTERGEGGDTSRVKFQDFNDIYSLGQLIVELRKVTTGSNAWK